MTEVRPTTSVCYSKWNGQQHWTCEGVLLGEDQHGHWIGLPVGTLWRKPEVLVRWDWSSVLLVPNAPYVATFYARTPSAEEADPVAVYVDVTTMPVHEPGRVTAIDLDLDVIRLCSGHV